MRLPAAMISGLESAINRYLQLDPDAAARMAALTGKRIMLEFRGLDLALYITPGEHGISLQESIEGEADTVLSGTPLGMLQIGLGGNSLKTLFAGDVQIEGDVETGQNFKAILDGMNIDWEEPLSRLTGDFVAHRLGNAARKTRKVIDHGRATLEQDVSEYLQEELRVLPARIEIENFSADSRRLAMAVERLEARINRLKKEGHNEQHD